MASGSIHRMLKVLVKSGDIESSPCVEVISNKDRIKQSTIKAKAYRLKKY